MCSIRRSFALLAMVGMLLGGSVAASAQQKTSATTGVNWVPATGTGAPTSTSCGGTCSSASYGLPYTNLSNGYTYVYTGTGAVSGWALTGGGGGINCLSGDVSTAGSGCTAATLATVLSTPGCQTLSGVYICFNGKGLTTALGSPFSASLSCGTNALCGSFEAGIGSTSPSNFTVGYANPSTATSSSLTDSYYNSAVTCSNTSGTTCQLPHSYCTVGQGVIGITYTLTAVGAGQTSTPQQGVNCLERSFAGAGGGGATGATASGTNATLAGATGTLGTVALSNSCAGQTFTATTSGTQYVYYLAPCNVSNPGGGSFTIGTSSGPTFPFNAPTSFTFTNQYGVTYTEYLYQSVNSYVSGTSYTIVVGS